MKKVIFLLLFQLSYWLGYGQVHCGGVDFITPDPVSLKLQFTSFSEYASGVTIIGATTLKLVITDKAVIDPDCRWFLTMEIENNPLGGTSSNDWETLVQFGTGSAPEPTLDILEVRISNNCVTSPIDGVFTKHFTNHGNIQDIIAKLITRVNAGSCISNVNGPGNYLTNYNEYTFRVDVRVVPSLNFKPGIYQVNLKFHLEEYSP